MRSTEAVAAAARCRRPSPALAAVAVLLAAGPALAHDFCLLSEPPRVDAGAAFDVAMHVAEVFPGETIPWRDKHIVEFFVTDAHGRNDVGTPVLEGDPARARLNLRGPGTAVVSLVTDASYIEMPAAEFEAYLEHDGHDAAREARRRAGQTDRPGRERYARHVKTILNATGPSASVALTRTGLTLEIVPETDLAKLAPGGRLPVRVFFRGGPLPDAPICATHDGREGGHDTYAWCGRLDGAGRAAVPIEAAGWQMIRASKMTAVRDDPKADWHSDWTSLTFHIDGPPPAATEAPR
jgi:uncharacterized protein DUF4198